MVGLISILSRALAKLSLIICLQQISLFGQGAQVGPCGTSSGPCGPPTVQEASIACGPCNSGYFALSCKCCIMKVGSPPQVPCAEVNTCETRSGNCQNQVCAKCCSQDLTPGSPRSCVCLKCTGMNCGSDSDCAPSGGLREGFNLRPGNLESFDNQIAELPVKLINEPSGMIAIKKIKIERILHGLIFHGITFSENRNPILAAVVTVIARADNGEQVAFSVFIDHMLGPRPLPTDHFTCPAQITGKDDSPIALEARLDYVLFANGEQSGVSKSPMHANLGSRWKDSFSAVQTALAELKQGKAENSLELLRPFKNLEPLAREALDKNFSRLTERLESLLATYRSAGLVP